MRYPNSENLVSLLFETRPQQQAETLLLDASFQPTGSLETEFCWAVRAAFADYWEYWFQEPFPHYELRELLGSPTPMSTILDYRAPKLPRLTANYD